MLPRLRLGRSASKDKMKIETNNKLFQMMESLLKNESVMNSCNTIVGGTRVRQKLFRTYEFVERKIHTFILFKLNRRPFFSLGVLGVLLLDFALIGIFGLIGRLFRFGLNINGFVHGFQ